MRLDHLLSKEKAPSMGTYEASVFVVQFSGLANLRRGLRYGGVAQLGEHLPCKQGVKGSSPFISTTLKEWKVGKGRTDTEWAHSSVG